MSQTKCATKRNTGSTRSGTEVVRFGNDADQETVAT